MLPSPGSPCASRTMAARAGAPSIASRGGSGGSPLVRYPAIKPAQARREAAAALERVREGVDPAEEKRARREMRTPETDTFGAVAQDYLEMHLRKNRRESTFLEAKRDLEHDALPAWRRRPIASISRRDVLDLIEGIVS